MYELHRDSHISLFDVSIRVLGESWIKLHLIPHFPKISCGPWAYFRHSPENSHDNGKTPSFIGDTSFKRVVFPLSCLFLGVKNDIYSPIRISWDCSMRCQPQYPRALVNMAMSQLKCLQSQRETSCDKLWQVGGDHLSSHVAVGNM